MVIKSGYYDSEIILNDSERIGIEKNLYLETYTKDRLLISTSVLKSFGDLKIIEIKGERFKVLPSYMGVDAKTVSRELGHSIKGVIGLDILNRFYTVFRLKEENGMRGNIFFYTPSEYSPPEDSKLTKLDLNFKNNVFPYFNLKIDKKEKRMLFDTGSFISYVLSEEFLKIAGEESDDFTDYYHGVGKHTTQTKIIKTKFGNLEIPLKFGTLPSAIEYHLKNLMRMDGIIGNEILRGRECVYMGREGIIIN